MESSQRRVISLLVDNQSGALARVSNLFCRRGFNIDTLTVSATNDPAVSRITLTITSDDRALKQLILQTERLEVTRQVFVLDKDKTLQRELLLLKVRPTCTTAPSCGRSPTFTRPRSLTCRRTAWCLN